MSSRTLCRIGLSLLAAAVLQPSTEAQGKPTTQQLEERLQKLEERLETTEKKAAAADKNAEVATLQNEYVKEVQSQAHSYYDKAFNTLVAIISIAVLAGGYLSFRVLDRTIQNALARATTQLRSEFAKQLADEKASLQVSNEAKILALEKAFQSKIETTAERIERVSQYQFQFAQGLAFFADKNWPRSINTFRRAVAIYAAGKPIGLIPEDKGTAAVRNLLAAVRRQGKTDEDKPKKVAEELDTELLKSLKHEVAELALKFRWVAEAIKFQKQAAD